MSTILDEIVEEKREQIEAEKRKISLADLKEKARRQPARFRDALAEEGLSLIAEIKPKAPSSGQITDLPAPEIARIYQQENVTAVSCLTDEPYFGQNLDTLRKVKTVLRKPILRKDFIIDPYQVYQSCVAGADAILLIASILEPSRLEELYVLTEELGMDALVEIHSGEEWDQLSFDPRITGINNRTLDGDFSTDLSVTEQLASQLPEHTLLVTESGIHDAKDVERLKKVDHLDAMLVGTSLLKDTTDPEEIRTRVRNLLGADS